MTAHQPPRTPSQTNRAIAQLRQMIVDGRLAAGSNHLESELAEMLQMSRTPVHEAALVLEENGLLELRPRKGVRILPISPSDMVEIYDVLTELECLAARNAAAFDLSDDDIAPLGARIDDVDQALAEENREAWAKADDLFHQELVRLGANSRVISISEMLSDQVRRARTVTLHIRPLPVASNMDHRALFNAIREGNVARADQIHRTHRGNAKAIILDSLKRHKLSHL